MKIAELFEALADAKVDYVLVGGLAVQLHGFLRATIDIDLVLAMSEDNLDRFLAVANRFGLIPLIPVPINSIKNREQIEQWHKEKGMLAFGLREPQAGGHVIDIMIKPVVPFEKLTADAVQIKFFRHEIRIAAIDDLMEMKRKANRPKDQIDLVALEKIKHGEDPNV